MTQRDDELTDEEVDKLAKRILERQGEAFATEIGDRIVQQIQLQIGKNALRALAYVAGALVVAAVAAMSSSQGFWKYVFAR